MEPRAERSGAFAPTLLPPDPSSQTLAQPADPAPGSWPRSTAATPPPASALAVTVGGRGGGFVYVIGDRFATRDSAVLLRELGHVLGAATIRMAT
jgi:hypothetical protein